MTRQSRRTVSIACLALAVGGLTACATGTPYAEVMESIPALPAGQGRIMVYMTDSSQPIDFYPTVTVDAVPVGTIRAGTFFYVDRPAGLHQVGIGEHQASVISNQIATEPVDIEVIPGETAYVHAEAVQIIARVQVVLRPEIPENAMRDLEKLSYVAQPPPE
jgi:hypothetical protein